MFFFCLFVIFCWYVFKTTKELHEIKKAMPKQKASIEVLVKPYRKYTYMERQLKRFEFQPYIAKVFNSGDLLIRNLKISVRKNEFETETLTYYLMQNFKGKCVHLQEFHRTILPGEVVRIFEYQSNDFDWYLNEFDAAKWSNDKFGNLELEITYEFKNPETEQMEQKTERLKLDHLRDS